MLCRTWWLRKKQWDSIWVCKSSFWSHTWIFSQKISAKSVTYTVTHFTKDLRLCKSGTKASGSQVCWQTIAGHWRGMHLTPPTGESHTPLHFRGKFLPVSWTCEVLFCTFKFLYIFETLPDRKILYTYLNSAQKSIAKFIYLSSWDKKKLNFVDQCSYWKHSNWTNKSIWPLCM